MKYGIDLGTTNSAICRMEKGDVVVKGNLVGDKYILPSCVRFTSRRIVVGDNAYSALANDPDNVFIEFKRTMGSPRKYIPKLERGPFAGKEYDSEELSSEVLKELRGFVQDEPVTAAVITVPAMFEPNQKEATRRAAEMAGIKQCALLQEPIAASMAYGLKTDEKNGYWLVFDFGGGTFDAALMNVEQGQMNVVGTEGNNVLGGKNLDNAIVDEIFLPQLRKEYNIENVTPAVRAKLKKKAEEVKNTMSTRDTYEVYTEEQAGYYGTDEDGKEINLEMTVTQQMLETALAPLFQKAIDLTKELLKRYNLKGSDLDSLILVGGPTKSPILQRMLKEQITPKIDISIDPMTAVAKGAALYASTIDVEIDTGEFGCQDSDVTMRVALDLQYDSTSINEVEYVIVKLLKKECIGEIPQELFVQFIRRKDLVSVSGKVPLTEMGDAIECNLLSGKTNTFSIEVIDKTGNHIPCVPNEFSIVPIGNPTATLPYNVGIEVWDNSLERKVFQPLDGMEVNRPLPAEGRCERLKVPNTMHPGNALDKLVIPVYIGKYGTQGMSAINNNHVFDVVITGDDLSGVVPAGSEIDITLMADKSEEYTMDVDFISSGDTIQRKVEIGQVAEMPYEEWEHRFMEAKAQLRRLSKINSVSDVELSKAKQIISDLEKRKDNEQQRKEEMQSLLNDLREAFRELEMVEKNHEWNLVEDELRKQFDDLEKANNDFGNRFDEQVHEMHHLVDQAIRSHDVKMAREVKRDCRTLWVEAAMPGILAAYVAQYDSNFGRLPWRDKMLARQLINKAQQLMNQNADVNEVRQVVIQLMELLPKDSGPITDLPVI